MKAMVRYHRNAWSTKDDPMTKAAPTEMVLGQMEKKTAPRASRTCMTTQMLVVMARMREARPKRTHCRETPTTNTRTMKRGTVLM